MRKSLPILIALGVLAGPPVVDAAPTPSPVPSAPATSPSPNVPPPTPVPPSGSPSPFPTELATPPPGLKPPAVDAKAAILLDLRTGQVLYRLHPYTHRPIASVTKLMTALVVLERTRPEDVVRIGAEAAEEGSSGTGFSELGLQRGEHLTIRQLLYALMLQSANDAAVALADAVSGSSKRFVALMNRTGEALGLDGSRFFSPNGLDDRGYSTARDVATISVEAFARPLLDTVVNTKFRNIPSRGGPPRHIQNRNVLLWLYKGTIGGKTGYTQAAGYCLVSAAARRGSRLAAVVLGEPTAEGSFSDVAALLDYGFHAFEQVSVVDAGDSFCCLRLHGELLPVAADGPLRALVPQGSAREATIRWVANHRALPPYRMGDKVGWARASLRTFDLGRVPVVVSGRPRPAPPLPGTEPRWWEQSVDFLVRATSDALDILFG